MPAYLCRVILFVVILGLSASEAGAQHTREGHAPVKHGGVATPPPTTQGGSIPCPPVQGPFIVYGPAIIVAPSYAPYVYSPPLLPEIPFAQSPLNAGTGGLMLPNVEPTPSTVTIRRPTSRIETEKADNLVTLGDRLFRLAYYKKADERYRQAIRANPGSAKPRVRLAQIALVKGDFKEAAEQFRAAITAEPGWLVNADDIQALYAEPAEFAKVVAKLERHLQAKPKDRDAWLVLGAQWYLSGRVHKASDVFVRLHDRAPDKTLAAFLDATSPDALPHK